MCSSDLLLQRYREQVQAWEAAAPSEPLAFLAWWPSLKRQVAGLCKALNKQARELRLPLSTASAQQLQAMYQRVEGSEGLAALPELLALRQQHSTMTAAQLADAAMEQRRRYLHGGERPSPGITARLRRPAAASGVPALRARNGTLTSNPAACAQITAKYWAHISRQPPTDPAAQLEVLSHLPIGEPLAEAAAALGAPEVGEHEVRQALKRSRAGTAPGLDTQPLELYRKAPAFIPLLARLFSAIGATGQLPHGFHDGLITVLHKAGDRSDPANYRPITLLNSDYRLLAKVLVHRLSPHLPKVIGPEQTAFIKGRSIGDSIHLLQLLPHLLAREGRWAMAVFCDFRKAYDTVDRAFLLSILQRLGVGPGFLAWVRLLLANTRSAALVNGALSNPERFNAGVRQGCPLAPLLYLFIGLALHCFLKAKGVGVTAAGQQHPGPQYADDYEALLEGGSLTAMQQRVATFLSAMRTFQAAAGQELNPAKTKLLPIGEIGRAHV